MPVNLRLGDVMPLLTSATGRCFAAWLSLRHLRHIGQCKGPFARGIDEPFIGLATIQEILR